MTKQLLIPDTQNLPKYQLKKKRQTTHLKKKSNKLKIEEEK